MGVCRVEYLCRWIPYLPLFYIKGEIINKQDSFNEELAKILVELERKTFNKYAKCNFTDVHQSLIAV